MAETSKSKPRRIAEGFFDKYVKGKVIDIGVGRIDTYDGADPLTDTCDTWDKDNGDAHLMDGVADETYDTVYCSHLIEHLENPEQAIHNWFRILKPGGYLIIAGPDRDSYERSKVLPSKWNADHKFYLTLNNNEPPNTYSLISLVYNVLVISDFDIVEAKTINTCTNVDKPNDHGDGEYQIEVIIKKL